MTDNAFKAAITDAALTLAAEQGWGRVTLARIAEAAGVPFDQLYGRVPTKTDVLDLLAQRFDAAAVGAFEYEPDATVRERVFDAAMARFDAMEPHRAGVVSIMDTVRGAPVLRARSWMWSVRSARWLLELAHVDTAGARGFARTRGFAAILMEVERAWVDDVSGDQARTMATLDRRLRDVADFTETWRRRLSGFRRRPQRDTAPPGPPPIDPTPRPEA